MSDTTATVSEFDLWLERELRSDHAGETGAVRIYQGILSVARDPALRRFATEHLATEQRHLEVIEEILPVEKRSLLLPPWRLAGWLTGVLPALFGPGAVYATIEAVETFVDRHYQGQIDALSGREEHRALYEALLACQADEVKHRDEAAGLAPDRINWILRLWMGMVGTGSSVAVVIARRL